MFEYMDQINHIYSSFSSGVAPYPEGQDSWLDRIVYDKLFGNECTFSTNESGYIVAFECDELLKVDLRNSTYKRAFVNADGWSIDAGLYNDIEGFSNTVSLGHYDDPWMMVRATHSDPLVNDRNQTIAFQDQNKPFYDSNFCKFIRQPNIRHLESRPLNDCVAMLKGVEYTFKRLTQAIQ